MLVLNPRDVRLAAYGLLAGVAGGSASADIQVYEGKPIELLGGVNVLSMGDLSFEFNIGFFQFTSYIPSDTYICCSYAQTDFGGTYCAKYGLEFSLMGRTDFYLRASCGSGVSSVGFGILDDVVGGGGGCNDFSRICSNSILEYSDCDIDKTWSTSTCNESRRFHIGMSVDNDGQTVFGWIQIDGTGLDLEITRWAYQDSGESIRIGEGYVTACDGDINNDGRVDGADLGLLIGNWGPCEERPLSDCEADIDGDGRVDGADLGLLMGNWNGCEGQNRP